jgi:hypothetical protein
MCPLPILLLIADCGMEGNGGEPKSKEAGSEFRSADFGLRIWLRFELEAHQEGDEARVRCAVGINRRNAAIPKTSRGQNYVFASWSFC